MTTHIEHAKTLLFDGADGARACNFKMYPGTRRDLMPEEMAEEIVKSIQAIESGDFEVLDLE